jgi:hypothetical protein
MRTYYESQGKSIYMVREVVRQPPVQGSDAKVESDRE